MTCFGWSVGDLVATVRTLARVVAALQEAEGAACDYQETIALLDVVASTLWNLQLYNEELKDTSHPVALPRHVETVKNSVMKFLQSIEPYEKTLGPERKQGWYRGVSSKTKWALFVAKEANILKERVAVPMTAINVNVGLQIMATIKVANSQLAEDLRDQISNALTKCIPSSLEEQLNLIKKAVSANTLALKQLQMRDQIDITLQLKDNKFMGRAPTLSQFTLQQNVEKASHTISDMQWLIQNSSQMKNSTDAFVVLKVENPWSEVKICLRRCAIIFGISILRFLEDILKILGPRLLLFIAALFQVKTRIRRVLLGDAIMFTDALGRKKSLPFEYFQNWNMMNTYLQESFNYCPGKRYVVTGHFELVDPRGDFIKKIEWANTVAPEMEITMIMTTTIVRKSGTYCQRCLAAINMRSVSYSEGNLSWACQSCGQHNSYHSPGRLKEPQIVEITDDIDANANVEAVAYDSSEPDSKNPIVDIYESWEYTLFKPVFIMVSDHWAMFIFDNVWSQTEMNIHRCEYSVCYSLPKEVKADPLASDDATLAQLTLPSNPNESSDSVQVSLYINPKGNAKIAAKSKKINTEALRVHKVQLTRSGPCVRLDTVAGQEMKPWANLTFTVWEEMVLFFCTFSVLEEQCLRGVKDPKEPNFDLGEEELFSEPCLMDEDENWITRHIHLHQDPYSNGVRLQGSFSFGPGKWCPLWIAFISSHRTEQHWVRRQCNVLTFRELRTYVFSHEFPSRKGLMRDFSLKFEKEESATRLAGHLARLGFSVLTSTMDVTT